VIQTRGGLHQPNFTVIETLGARRINILWMVIVLHRFPVLPLLDRVEGAQDYLVVTEIAGVTVEGAAVILRLTYTKAIHQHPSTTTAAALP